MLIHKFPWVWWSGQQPVETANTGAAARDASANNLKVQIRSYHICVRSSAFECSWRKVRECEKCVCVCEWSQGLQGVSKAFQQSIYGSKTLAIKQRFQLLSKVHLRSYCGEFKRGEQRKGEKRLYVCQGRRWDKRKSSNIWKKSRGNKQKIIFKGGEEPHMTEWRRERTQRAPEGNSYDRPLYSCLSTQ